MTLEEMVKEIDAKLHFNQASPEEFARAHALTEKILDTVGEFFGFKEDTPLQDEQFRVIGAVGIALARSSLDGTQGKIN